ncbi:hypothetical protein PSP20601_05080 [Pandoraea sputorum]|nr:hypothetical protein PSP20601_05080 [Pandoraea sputorum]
MFQHVSTSFINTRATSNCLCGCARCREKEFAPTSVPKAVQPRLFPHGRERRGHRRDGFVPSLLKASIKASHGQALRNIRISAQTCVIGKSKGLRGSRASRSPPFSPAASRRRIAGRLHERSIDSEMPPRPTGGRANPCSERGDSRSDEAPRNVERNTPAYRVDLVYRHRLAARQKDRTAFEEGTFEQWGRRFFTPDDREIECTALLSDEIIAHTRSLDVFDRDFAGVIPPVWGYSAGSAASGGAPGAASSRRRARRKSSACIARRPPRGPSHSQVPCTAVHAPVGGAARG